MHSMGIYQHIFDVRKGTILMSNLSEKITVSRRGFVATGAATIATVAGLGLAGCSDETASTSGSTDSGSAASGTEEDTAATIDTAAYASLIGAGTVADDATVSASEWATSVKDAGTLRIGGVQTSLLFSLLDETDNQLRGFDAGLSQLLARYILGDESKYELTQVTSDTRESVLQNDQVDAVFATYSITDDRKKVISFAGPYFTTQQSILTMADDTSISSVDDLAGKNVAVQSGSTGPEIVAELAPDATLQEFKTDEEARQALEQGRVDAYVIDTTMQMGSMVRQPGKYRLAGDPFGPLDSYGIGLPKDSDGVQFVNDFLTAIEADGTWDELWKICIGDRAGIENAPEPPAIEA